MKNYNNRFDLNIYADISDILQKNLDAIENDTWHTKHIIGDFNINNLKNYGTGKIIEPKDPFKDVIFLNTQKVSETTVDLSELTKKELLDDADKQLEANFTISNHGSIFPELENVISRRKEEEKKLIDSLNDCCMLLENIDKYELLINAIGITKKRKTKKIKLYAVDVLNEIIKTIRSGGIE